jgi:hypothetical protein
MTLFFVYRVPPTSESDGRLVEPLGFALTQEEALAMCSGESDTVVDVETGKVYPSGENLPDDTRLWRPWRRIVEAG